MGEYIVQIAETNNYEIPIEAASIDEARDKAMEQWRKAPTVGQWEIADMNTEIVAVTEAGKAALEADNG